MGHRQSVYVHRTEPARPGEPPNAKVPAITVEVRVFYPDSCPDVRTEYDAKRLLAEATGRAQNDITRQILDKERCLNARLHGDG